MSPHAHIVERPGLRSLARLAVPNLAASLIQSLLIVVDGWYAGVLGNDALSAIALVFPVFMLTMMLSAGAIGGAVSGAMARAVGAGDLDQANRVLRIAVVIAVSVGTLKGLLILLAGPELFSALGGAEAVLEQAEAYANTLFPAIALIWLTNMLAGCLRGTGDMIPPAIATALIVLTHFALIAGQVSLGAPLGLAGAAWALLGAYAVGLIYLVWAFTRPGSSVGLSLDHWRSLSGGWRILSAGMLASSQSLITIAYSLIVTAFIGRFGQEWLAGYGLGARLELLLIPIIFGIGGASMVATGTLLGAGQRAQAIRMGLIGAFTAAGLVGVVGLVVAVFPGLWTGLFTNDPAIAGAAAAYLRIVGPLYAFFGLGLCLYFSSQGMATLLFPVLGAVLRFGVIVVALTALSWAGVLTPLATLVAISAAMVFYGLFNAVCLHFGPWSLQGSRAIAAE